MTLGPRGELWTLHAHYTLVRDELHPAALGRQGARDGALEPLHQPAAERIAKSGVRDDGRALEEARGAHALGAIDDLRRQRERAWRDVLAEGADGAECEEGPDAEGFEGCYVRAGGDGRRAEGVSLSVTSEEGDSGA